MKKVLLVTMMLLMVASVGFCQRTVTSSTDYFYVPTAEVVPGGGVSVAVQAAGDEIWSEDNNVGVIADLGVTDRLMVSVTSDIEEFNTDNLTAGVKFVAGPREDGTGQLALFLYDIHDSHSAIPGAALTVDDGVLSWTVAGWNDDGWECGGGATLTLTENMNVQAEYSTQDKWAYGVGLNYKNLFGEVRYLDETSEFYGAAGIRVGW